MSWKDRATVVSEGDSEPSWKDRATAVHTQEPTSAPMAALSGLGQGATLGFGDELAGGAGAIIDSIMDDKSRPFVERYREARDFARKINSNAATDRPWTYGAGSLLGGITSTAPAGAAAGTIKGAAALGGLFGLGSSNADLTKGEYGKAALDTGIGAGTSAATAGIVNTALGKYSPQMKDFAARSNLRGAGFRGREITPYELSSEGSDLLNKAKVAADEGVLGPFASKETMMNRAKALRDLGSKGMDDILSDPNVQSTQLSSVRMARKAGEALQGENFVKGAPLLAPEERAIDKVKDSIIATGVGQGKRLGVDDLQFALKGMVDKSSRWAKVGELPESAAEAETMRKASGFLRSQIDDVVSSKLGTQGLQALQKARQLHGTGAEFANVLNREAGNDLANTLRGNTVKGPIDSLISVPFEKANQMIGYGTNKLANALNKTPQMLGQYAPEVQAAAAKSGSIGTAVFNNIKQQTDPQYREIIKHISESNDNNEGGL